jgi:hypothetical protein
MQNISILTVSAKTQYLLESKDINKISDSKNVPIDGSNRSLF